MGRQEEAGRGSRLERLPGAEVERESLLGFWFLLKMEFIACLMVILGHVREELRSPKTSEDTSRQSSH